MPDAKFTLNESEQKVSNNFTVSYYLRTELCLKLVWQLQVGGSNDDESIKIIGILTAAHLLGLLTTGDQQLVL